MTFFKKRLESAFNVVLEERFSDYNGGAYYKYRKSNELTISLKQNFMNYFEEWDEPDFKEYDLILNLSFKGNKGDVFVDELQRGGTRDEESIYIINQRTL